MKFSLSKQAVESLVCPLCKQQCNPTTQGLECKKCNKTYPLKPISYGNYTIHTPFLHPDENQPAKISLQKYEDASDILFHANKPEHTESAKLVYAYLKEQLIPVKGIIVDNGCGDNSFRYLMQKKIFSLELKKYGSPYYPIQIFVDSTHLPFKENTVDLFVSNFVIQEIKDKKAYLAEMYRALKSKGKVFISFPSPFWYIAFFVSPASYKAYVKKIIKNPKLFVKNPFKHFLHENTHGCKEYFFVKEFFVFKSRNYENVFKELGFKIEEKIQSGNIFSLYPRYKKLSKILKNWKIKSGIHYTYVLEK